MRNASIPANSSLSDVFGGLRHRKYLILGTTLAGLIAGEVFLVANKPSYQAEAQVIVESLSTPFDKSTAVQDASAPDLITDRMVQSQVSVLKSSDINGRVVDQLGLESKPDYNAQLRVRSMAGKIAIAMGFKDDPAAFTPKELATKTLASSVTVYAVPESNVIGIKSNSGTGELAAATANAIAETYVLSTHETGANSNDRARTWLSQQVNDLRAKVSSSENAVEKYRAEAGLFKGQTSTLGTQQISELNSQITVAETARAEVVARVNEIRNMLAARGQVDASADVLASSTVQNLREQQVTAQRRISELSATYLPSHPKMIAARKELESINGQVRNEALKVVDSLTGQAKVAEARAASLQASLNKLKGSEAEANVSDVKLKELEREAEANRTLLQNMLNRYADANARQDTSLQPGFARVIQKAMPPATPYFPKAGPLLILSTIAGLALGLGLGFVFELLATPLVVSPHRLETRSRRHPVNVNESKVLVVPDIDVAVAAALNLSSPAARASEKSAGILGSIPAALTPNAAQALLGEVTYRQNTKFNDAILRLASLLVDMKTSSQQGSFAFASLGSTAPNAALATIALARALAMRGEKVVALDVAKLGGRFDVLLDLAAGPGLTDLIAGKADFTKIVARDPASPLHVVRLGQSADAATQAVLGNRLEAVVAALKTIYGYVLIHVGDATADAVPLLQIASTAIFLATPTRLKEADAAAMALEENGRAKAMIVKLEPMAAAAADTAASA